MKRKNGIDLLRILSMVMVISLHFLGRGNYLSCSTGKYFYFVWGIEFLCFSAVNIYVLITGYFLSKKDKISIKKIIDFMLQIWIIDLVVTFILVKTNLYTLDNSDYIKLLFPFISKSNWFFSCYIILYLFHPFLNKLINCLKVNEYRYLIVLMFILFSFLITVSPDVSWTFDDTKGYGIIWFCFLYFFGGYVRRFENNKIFNLSKVKYLLFFLLSVGLMFGEYFLLKSINDKLVIPYSIDRVYGYNNIFIFIAALSLFLLFRKIDIKNKFFAKLIMINTPLVFGVSLIHSQRFLKLSLWTEILNVDRFLNTPKMLLALVFYVSLVYICCAVFEYIRQFVLKKLKVSEYLSEKIYNIKVIKNNDLFKKD